MIEQPDEGTTAAYLAALSKIEEDLKRLQFEDDAEQIDWLKKRMAIAEAYSFRLSQILEKLFAAK